jgi:Tfp pilus assembly protein PilO
MQLGTINKTQITVAAIILEIAFCVLFYLYYYVPKTTELAELKIVIEKKQRDKREIELTKKNLAEAQRDIDNLKREIEHLEKYLPEKVYVPRVLVLIESLATATRLNILSIRPAAVGAARAPVPGAPVAGAAAPVAGTTTPGAPTTPGMPGEKPKMTFNPDMEYRQSVIDFQATGDFPAVINFMRELASFPKLVVVNHIAISVNSQPDKNTQPQGGKVSQTAAASGMPYNPKGGPAAQLSVTMPLTFYIQQQPPQLKF